MKWQIMDLIRYQGKKEGNINVPDGSRWSTLLMIQSSTNKQMQ